MGWVPKTDAGAIALFSVVAGAVFALGNQIIGKIWDIIAAWLSRRKRHQKLLRATVNELCMDMGTLKNTLDSLKGMIREIDTENGPEKVKWWINIASGCCMFWFDYWSKFVESDLSVEIAGSFTALHPLRSRLEKLASTLSVLTAQKDPITSDELKWVLADAESSSKMVAETALILSANYKGRDRETFWGLVALRCRDISECGVKLGQFRWDDKPLCLIYEHLKWMYTHLEDPSEWTCVLAALNMDDVVAKVKG